MNSSSFLHFKESITQDTAFIGTPFMFRLVPAVVIPCMKRKNLRSCHRSMRKIERVIKVMNRIYWSKRVSSPHQEGYLYLMGLWSKPDFTAYDYDDGDAKNAINEIAEILRSSVTSLNSLEICGEKANKDE